MTASTLAEDWPAIAAHAAHHGVFQAAEALSSWRALNENRRIAWRASADAVRMLLDAPAGNGTLRSRITRLAEAWEANPKQQTEEGQLLRELAQVLRDELGHASDREPKPAPELAMPAPARGVDPASIEYRVHAHAFNALTRALPADLFILSDRQAVADAIVDAIEPLIRADEGAAIAARGPFSSGGIVRSPGDHGDSVPLPLRNDGCMP